MAYNVYRGNSGVRRRVETPGPERRVPPPPPPQGPPEPPPPPQDVRRGGPGPSCPRRSGQEGLFSRINLRRMETEDLLVLAILALAYNCSGDWEMLVALGAYLLL